MNPDVINGLFEACGSLAVWLNVFALVRDKGYAGTRWPMAAFFTSWGYWNLYYYPHLGQWVSLAGGALLSVANTVGLGLMLYYGRKK